MKKLGYLFVCVAFYATALAGCTGFEVRDANQQLTAAYTAKAVAESRQPRDETGVLLAASALDGLADDAGTAAARETGANQVSLYRIAVVAAWQAGDSEATDAYAIAGQSACAAMTEPPQRDCGMLSVVPELRSIDEQTDELEVLARRLDGSRPTPEDIQETEGIYNNYANSFSKLMEQRAAWAGAAVPVGMLTAVDANLGVLVCNQMDQLLMRQFRRTNNRQMVDARQGSINAMKCRMATEGVSVARAPCAICR